MTFEQVLGHLKSAGTEQYAKVYRRHGARGDLFGVSYADMGRLRKQIHIDHNLALRLWDSGNVDARMMATMIADPLQATSTQLDLWVKATDNYLLADMVAFFTVRTTLALTKARKWMKSDKEFVRQCGYVTLATAIKDGVEIGDAECETILATIEKEIHASPNRARHAMNNAVIAIGIFRPALTAAAIETAQRIGRVEVDHGKTSCQTPDAAVYIRKATAGPNNLI